MRGSSYTVVEVLSAAPEVALVPLADARRGLAAAEPVAESTHAVAAVEVLVVDRGMTCEVQREVAVPYLRAELVDHHIDGSSTVDNLED